MHREKRQNRITEQRKIQKEICRILLIFTMILSMICVVNLTGCRDRKSQEQTELISLDGREPDVEKADGNTEKEAEGSETGTDDNMTEKDGLKQEKLQICYVHVCGAVKSPGVYELTSDSRLYEAIQMAGGFTDEAAGEALNQAEYVQSVHEYDRDMLEEYVKTQKPEQRTTVLSYRMRIMKRQMQQKAQMPEVRQMARWILIRPGRTN